MSRENEENTSLVSLENWFRDELPCSSDTGLARSWDGKAGQPSDRHPSRHRWPACPRGPQEVVNKRERVPPQLRAAISAAVQKTDPAGLQAMLMLPADKAKKSVRLQYRQERLI
jgi:hypothetical protein